MPKNHVNSISGMPQNLRRVSRLFVSSIDDGMAIKSAEESGDYMPETIDGVHVIPMRGSIGWNYFSGINVAATSAEIARASMRSDVKSILLRINSGGGEAIGSFKLADAVREAAEKKPVVAYVDGMAASGAMLIASQATAIYGHKMSEVGSIGVICMMADPKGMYEQAGWRIELFRTGELKAVGTKLPLSEKEKTWLESNMEELRSEFSSYVAEGRNIDISTLEDATSDGRVMFATEAVELGLMDGINSVANTLAGLQRDDWRVNSIEPRQAAKGGNTVPTMTQVFAALLSGEEVPEGTSDKDLENAKAMVDLVNESRNPEPEKESQTEDGLSADDVKNIVMEVLAGKQETPDQESDQELSAEDVDKKIAAAVKAERDRCVSIVGISNGLGLAVDNKVLKATLSSDVDAKDAEAKLIELAASEFSAVSTETQNGLPGEPGDSENKFNAEAVNARCKELQGTGLNYDQAYAQAYRESQKGEKILQLLSLAVPNSKSMVTVPILISATNWFRLLPVLVLNPAPLAQQSSTSVP